MTIIYECVSVMNKGNRTLVDTTRNESFDFGRGFFENSLVLFSLLFTAVFFLIAIIILIWSTYSRPPVVIVHYNVYFGVDLIGIWWQVFSIPAVAIVFCLTNMALAYYLYAKKERVAAYILLLASSFIAIGTVLSCVSIAIINY